jgi:plasmid replication initiation protein
LWLFLALFAEFESLPNGKGKRSVLLTGWVQSITYSDAGGEVSLRFGHDMLPYLTNLSKNFTKYSLRHVAKMTSGFGFRMYELLVQWRNEGKKSTEVSVDWIKKTFKVENKYRAIKDFKKYVLEPAIRDVNKHSDLRVEWAQRKTGRKVTHLKFNFETKEENKKKRLTEKKILGVKVSEIKKVARPGESYEEAAERIKREDKLKKQSELA